MFLSLPLERGGSVSLKACFKRFSSTERLRLSDQWWVLEMGKSLSE